MNMKNATSRLVRIGLAANDHLDAQRRALELIREIVYFDAASLATVDPGTILWTSCVLQGIPEDEPSEAFMFENEYRQHDLNRIADLARQPAHAGRLSQFSRTELDTSARFKMLRQQGAVDELRCAAVENGVCWASFELYRIDDTGAFDENDVRRATALSRPLAQMIRFALLKQAASKPDRLDDPPAFVVIDRQGSITGQSPGCETLFQQISDTSHPPPALRSLALRAIDDVDGKGASIVLPRLSGGWIRLHAVPLTMHGEQLVNVIIEPARQASIPETIAGIFGFTPRECDVVSLLARGLSAREMAEELKISPHTVNDHLKAAFLKAGVQSRQQLVASLFFDFCLPLRRADTTPGPYGWFLDSEIERAAMSKAAKSG